MENILLVDADSLLWQSGYCKKEESEDGFIHDPEEAIFKFETNLINIFEHLDECGYTVSKYQLFIGGSNNFRKIINKGYKANRMFQVKPPTFADVEFHAITHWNAYVCNGVEADDVVVATRKKILDTDFDGTKNVIVASIDKDYKQVADLYFYNYHHYHLNLKYIEANEAVRFFYKQMLMGDGADNIEGVSGIGKKKADDILGESSEYGYFRRAYGKYVEFFGRRSREMWVMNKTMLRLVDEGIDTPNEDDFNVA